MPMKESRNYIQPCSEYVLLLETRSDIELGQSASATASGSCGTAKAMRTGRDSTTDERLDVDFPHIARLAVYRKIEHLVEVAIVDLSEPVDAQ